VPVLTIWGEEDGVSPLENGRILEQEVASCRLVVISGAPHPCYLDNAPQFHSELHDFLTGLP
jgi:pimeloyl-ACP methyl ester carboxylesterase